MPVNGNLELKIWQRKFDINNPNGKHEQMGREDF